MTEFALEDQLRATSDKGLLTSFAALTHRMGDVSPGVSTAQRRANRLKKDRLRQQRDKVEAELLRRTAQSVLTERQVNRLAQRFYENAQFDGERLRLARMTDKPMIVNGLLAVFDEIGIRVTPEA